MLCPRGRRYRGKSGTEGQEIPVTANKINDFSEPEDVLTFFHEMKTPGRTNDDDRMPRKLRGYRERPFTETDIEQRAYGLWQNEGGKRSETDYWHQAREELEREYGS